MVPEEKTEEQLAAELEDMYRRVASNEKPEEADDQGDAIRGRQTLEETSPASSTAVVVETAGNLAADNLPPLLTPPLPQRRRRRRTIPGARAAVLICVCFLLYSAVFWPTLYDVTSINTGGQIYPVRINRITGDVSYFDGVQWRNAPVPASIRPVPVTPVPVAKAPASEATIRTPAAPVAAALPAAPAVPLLQKEALPERRSASMPAPATQRTQIQASSTHPERQPPLRETMKDRPFAIQIKSYDHPAEARKLVEDLRKTGMEADTVAATISDRGIWNRVLIGRFKDPGEALIFMQKHKIKDAYPGSFIQKRSP